MNNINLRVLACCALGQKDTVLPEHEEKNWWQLQRLQSINSKDTTNHTFKWKIKSRRCNLEKENDKFKILVTKTDAWRLNTEKMSL